MQVERWVEQGFSLFKLSSIYLFLGSGFNNETDPITNIIHALHTYIVLGTYIRTHLMSRAKHTASNTVQIAMTVHPIAMDFTSSWFDITKSLTIQLLQLEKFRPTFIFSNQFEAMWIANLETMYATVRLDYFVTAHHLYLELGQDRHRSLMLCYIIGRGASSEICRNPNDHVIWWEV